ncbi:MAG: hypothetical protein ACM31C_18575 [Acidobacteriota bacterium]
MRCAWLVVLAGCGRLGFGSHATGDAPIDMPGDSAGDGSLDAARDAGGDAAYVCTGFVCDSLDGATIDPRWTLDTNAGTIAPDTTRVYRGTSSVHLHTDAISMGTTNPRAELLTSQGFPVTGTIHARAWMYFASPMPGSPFAQLLNFANTAGVGISMGARSAFVVDNDYTTPQYAQSTVTMLPLDRWTCLQLDLPSGISGTTHVYVDGVEVPDIATSQTNQPAPDHVYLGIEWVGTVTSQAAFDAWIDEIAIDTNPVPCN